MRLATNSYRPVTNKATVLLLTLVMMSFGVFAQYEVDTHQTAGTQSGDAATALVVARNARN